MNEIVLNVKKREKMTKGELNSLRKSGYVPGVIYSKELDSPINFTVMETALNKLIFTSETHIVNLTFENGEEHHAIVKDVQFDPLTDKVIHVDFHAVKFGQAITVEVPVYLVGTAKGIKEGGNLMNPVTKLEIECLPRQIPEKLEIDVTDLGLNDSIFVKDLNYEGVKILNQEDTLIVTVAAKRAEEVEETEELPLDEEAAEPEVISKGKSEEDGE
ncbi:MAG: 50S ribosomal protein L25 [Ignavibacteria bacterium]|nr:MAG: 50S ribosomal protein L25 [Ignavibacteria bacterium]